MFTLDRPLDLEESLTCEFKEAISQPLQAVGKIVDRHVVAFLNAEGGSIYWGVRDGDRVVTGLKAPAGLRDELRQVIGQKIAAIAPALPLTMVEAPFHPVTNLQGEPVQDTHVLEVRVKKPKGPGLFLTGNGEAYRRTLGGLKKLSGPELLMELSTPLQSKVTGSDEGLFLARFPTVVRRLEVAAPLVRGRRVLWVDDNPSWTFYERVALAEMGAIVDVATSDDEGLAAGSKLRPDVILSDMSRYGVNDAGIQFLRAARGLGIDAPIVFYVGDLDQRLGVPLGAFGITNRPDELLHLVLDVLERSG